MDVASVSEGAIQRLEIAIDRYRQIVAAGGWSLVGGGASLRFGGDYPPAIDN